MLYVRSDLFEIHFGDAGECLADIAPGSVQTIVTSPPYFDMRDYGTAIWEGGNADCDHAVPAQASEPKSSSSTLGGSRVNQRGGAVYREECGVCGATRNDDQVGIEEDQAAYAARLAQIFEASRAALSESGSLWLNIGETYVEGEPSGAPWAVVAALRSNGWKHISTVIWDKSNAMPESAKNRPSNSFEYVFLLAPGRHYFRHQTANGNHERAVWRGPTAAYRGNHVAVMPVWLAQKCVLLTSRSGEIVLDPFAGSGTTLVAALGYGRRAIGIDLRMANCGQQVRRIESEVFARGAVSG